MTSEHDGLAKKAHQKPSLFRTSASDLRGYEWQLEKRAVLLESSHRDEHRHIYTQGLEILESEDILGIIDFRN